MKRRIYNFTLLEIVICIALLAMAAAAISWPMKNMISAHQFQKNIGNFFIDLQRAQLIALSDRVDIDLKIAKEKGSFCYSFHTDDPLPHFTSLPRALAGVKEIKRGNKKIEDVELHIFPSGRIGPEEKIGFVGNHEIILDLTTPLCVELKRLN